MQFVAPAAINQVPPKEDRTGELATRNNFVYSNRLQQVWIKSE